MEITNFLIRIILYRTWPICLFGCPFFLQDTTNSTFGVLSDMPRAPGYNNQFSAVPHMPSESRRAVGDALYVRLQQPIPLGVLLEMLCMPEYNIQIPYL